MCIFYLMIIKLATAFGLAGLFIDYIVFGIHGPAGPVHMYISFLLVLKLALPVYTDFSLHEPASPV